MDKNLILCRIKKYIKNDGECWIWTGAKSGNHAVITINSHHYGVRKLLISILNPEKNIPKNWKFKCKNKSCININHLIDRDEYFESLIYKNEYSNCWEWKGATRNGYGLFIVDRKNYFVHRLNYEKHKGKIPKNKNVCHSCDNTICCNPDHLWIGTQYDNVQDMMKKNRGNKAKGEKHHRCKITENDARNIKLKYKEGMTIKDIHILLNISYRIVQHICANETWKHITV